MSTTVETTGTISSQRQIVLDDALPANTPERVRVIVIFDEKGPDIDEAMWLEAGSKNEVFDFLKDDAEDIYTLADGTPIHDEK